MGGSLKVVIQYSRPVRIEYLDTGEAEEMETITQLAIVGKVETTTAIFKVSQIWVGRVFPQWRAQLVEKK